MKKNLQSAIYILIIIIVLSSLLTACHYDDTYTYEKSITFNVLDSKGKSITVNVVASCDEFIEYYIDHSNSKFVTEIKGDFDFNSVNDNNSKSKFYLCKDFFSFGQELGREYKDYVELLYAYANINIDINLYKYVSFERWAEFVNNETLYLRCYYFTGEISYYISEQDVEYLTIYEIVGVDDEDAEIREYTHLPVIQKTKNIFMGFYDEKDGEGIKYVDSKGVWIDTPVSDLILYPYFVLKPNCIYILGDNHETSLLSENVVDDMPNLPQVDDIVGWYIAGTNIKIADANGVYRPGYESITNIEYQSEIIEDDETCILTLEYRYD